MINEDNKTHHVQGPSSINFRANYMSKQLNIHQMECFIYFLKDGNKLYDDIPHWVPRRTSKQMQRKLLVVEQ